MTINLKAYDPKSLRTESEKLKGATALERAFSPISRCSSAPRPISTALAGPIV